MKLGWAFFALAAVVALAYAMNRGVYVGSKVYFYKETTWGKDCYYLFPSGVHTVNVSAGQSAVEADRGFCPFFQPQY
jgi:hypothetical protein